MGWKKFENGMGLLMIRANVKKARKNEFTPLLERGWLSRVFTRTQPENMEREARRWRVHRPVF